jgi:hypothetical protein
LVPTLCVPEDALNFFSHVYLPENQEESLALFEKLLCSPGSESPSDDGYPSPNYVDWSAFRAEDGYQFKIQLWPLLDCLYGLDDRVPSSSSRPAVWSPGALLNVSWDEERWGLCSRSVYADGTESWVTFRPWDADRRDELEAVTDEDLKPRVSFVVLKTLKNRFSGQKYQ